MVSAKYKTPASMCMLTDSPGFAGSGQEFRTKSSRIANRIVESITPQIIDEFPGGIEFLYPNGTLNLEAPIGFGGRYQR
jgi:hypothetical protein